MRASGSGDERKVVIRNEGSGWNIDFSGEKPATPLLDTVNYPIHMKNLSTKVSMFMDMGVFAVAWVLMDVLFLHRLVKLFWFSSTLDSWLYGNAGWYFSV